MMRSPALIGFVSGALAMGYLVAATFFLRFWASSRDRLFLAFAGAFALMATAQIFTLARIGREEDGHVYLPRLAAFVLIIVAILLKNLPSRRA
ncbi:MAG TPA: DUF5985 family protein [Caulobacter sp.]|nr:DUF5985 family protein [Caulobacter sp.]